MVEKHYVQVLLYYGILYYNFHLQNTDIRLIYSKYPLPEGLMGLTNLMKLTYEALRFRNEAIALEFDIASRGFAHVLPQLRRQPERAQKHDFFNSVPRPPLEATLSPLHGCRV